MAARAAAHAALDEIPTALVLLALAAASAGCGDADPAPRRPNLLLVSIDTLRADRLSCYGNERITSPHVDALAREGVLFEDVQSPTSWTLPSHVTMLTGLPISMHGVCDHRLWTQTDLASLPVRGSHLGEMLQRAGYATAGFYSWKYLEPQFGFGPGFETYEGVAYSVATLPGVGPEFVRLRDEGRLEEARALIARHKEELDPYQPTGHRVIDRALSWLDDRAASEDADRPFFLFVHLFDVHDPYTPPAPWNTRFDPDYEGPVDGRDVAEQGAIVNPNMRPRDLEHLIALYDGEIGWTDEQLGRLLERLRELDQLDDTLVVVTSDHGEEFFEHGLKTHRKQLYKESVHVPLVMRHPERLPAGVRVAEPVGLVDLVPTLCALLDVAPPPGVPGRDLSSVAHGTQAESAGSNGEYLTELLHFSGEDPGPPVRKLGLRRGDERVLVVWEPDGTARAERFDLGRDPRESGPGEPILPGTPEWSELERRLEALRERLLAARARIPERPLDVEHLDAADLEELAAFGYVDSGGATATAAADRLCFDGCVWVDG